MLKLAVQLFSLKSAYPAIHVVIATRQYLDGISARVLKYDT